MKRFAMMILVGMLILVLAACGNVEEAVDFTSDEYLAQYDHNPAYTHTGSAFCKSEDAAYFYSAMFGGEKSYLAYADLATGVSGPLCGKPECNHTDSTCNAYISASMHGLSLYDQRLYWMEFVNTSDGFRIASTALDGTDRTTVRMLDFDAVGKATNGRLVMFHRGYVYISAVTATVTDGVPYYGSYVYAAPLEGDGEGTVILDKTFSDSELGVYVWAEPYRNSLYIAEATYLKEPYTLTLNRWDITNQTLETLFSEEVSFLFKEFSVMEDGILFSSQSDGNIYKYDFTSGELNWLFDMADGEAAAPCFGDGMIIDGFHAVDFQGQMLVNHKVEYPEYLAGSCAQIFCGVDQEGIYCFLFRIDNGITDNTLMEVSLATGETRLLWRVE